MIKISIYKNKARYFCQIKISSLQAILLPLNLKQLKTESNFVEECKVKNYYDKKSSPFKLGTNLNSILKVLEFLKILQKAR
jgi:hypothetical protein